MNKVGHIREELLGYSFIIYDESFNRTHLPEQNTTSQCETKSDAIIKIFYSEDSNENRKDLKWFSLLEGKFAYNRDRVYIEINNDRYQIKYQGSSLNIYAPSELKGKRLSYLVLDISKMLYLRKKGYYPLHASGVSAGTNILILGKTGCGKSTLAARIYESGAKMFSDDLVFLMKDQGQIKALSEDNRIMLREASEEGSSGKIQFNPDGRLSRSQVMEMIPELLIFPSFKTGNNPEIEEIPPAQAVMKLVPLTLPPQKNQDLNILIELAQQSRSFDLGLPSVAENPQAIKEILKQLIN
jgi:hypothetical protein